MSNKIMPKVSYLLTTYPKKVVLITFIFKHLHTVHPIFFIPNQIVLQGPSTKSMSFLTYNIAIKICYQYLFLAYLFKFVFSFYPNDFRFGPMLFILLFILVIVTLRRGMENIFQVFLIFNIFLETLAKTNIQREL